ncbi:MAG: hypothetical protein LC130_16750 [Bryobacterales bacterium]|nr:hypothetical protein [Bryobacterales bacterium]
MQRTCPETESLGPFAVFFYSAVEASVLSVDFTEMWETENEANKIFNTTRKDDPVDDEDPDANGDTYGVPRNYLYMVPDPNDGTYKVTLKADIQPADLRTRFYAAGYVGSQIVSGSGRIAFDSNGECELNFLHPGSSDGVENFTIKVGFDQNGNNELDSGDLLVPCSVKNTTTGQVIGDPIVRGSSENRYASAKDSVDDIVNGDWTTPGWLTSLVLPHAKRLLQIFRDGSASGVPSDKQPTSSSSLSFNAFTGSFAEWLTHNSGAAFDSSGSATITEYSWDESTSLADLVGTAPQIEDEVTDFYNEWVYPYVTNYFASLPVGSSNDFPSSIGGFDVAHTNESPPWVTPYTTTLDTWLPNTGDDVNGAIGRGRLVVHKARYRVEKRGYFPNDLVVTEVHSWGEVQDLYDFNHDAIGETEAARDAAILQIGFGNGSYGSSRNRGKIFRDRIEFDIPYTVLP